MKDFLIQFTKKIIKSANISAIQVYARVAAAPSFGLSCLIQWEVELYNAFTISDVHETYVCTPDYNAIRTECSHKVTLYEINYQPLKS